MQNDEVKLVEPAVPQQVVDAFENRYRRLFDLSRDDHEWRNTLRYKHDHVQSRWEGWRDGYLNTLSAIPSTVSGETVDQIGFYRELELLWRDMDKSHMVPTTFLDRLSDLIDVFPAFPSPANPAEPQAVEVGETVRAPVHPNATMIVAGAAKIGGGSTFDAGDRYDMAAEIYRAMLAVAPANPIETQRSLS